MGLTRLMTLGTTTLLLVASGAATAAQESAENETLLPGVALAIEEVGPGITKVTSDGVHDLSWDLPSVIHRDDPLEIGAAGRDAASLGVVAGYDGSIWLTRNDEVFKLGQDDSHRWHGLSSEDMEVSPDGHLWLLGEGLSTFDGERWSNPFMKAPRDYRVTDVQMQPDGTLWALLMREDGKLLRVARAQGDEWVPLGWKFRQVWARSWPDVRLDVTADGVWLFAGRRGPRGTNPTELVRFRGDTVREIEAPTNVSTMAAGPDGTVWLSVHRADGPVLARRDGTTWTRFTAADGVRPVASSDWDRTSFVASPDGSVWSRPAAEDDGSFETCWGLTSDDGGLVNFDGERWLEFLTDQCIYAMDIAPDGRVWALAGTRESWPWVWTEDLITPSGSSPTGPVELYVIDPSAVVAA